MNLKDFDFSDDEGFAEFLEKVLYCQDSKSNFELMKHAQRTSKVHFTKMFLQHQLCTRVYRFRYKKKYYSIENGTIRRCKKTEFNGWLRRILNC